MFQLAAGYLLGRNKKKKEQQNREKEEEERYNRELQEYYRQLQELQRRQQQLDSSSQPRTPPSNRRGQPHRQETRYYYQEPGESRRVEVMEEVVPVPRYNNYGQMPPAGQYPPGPPQQFMNQGGPQRLGGPPPGPIYQVGGMPQMMQNGYPPPPKPPEKKKKRKKSGWEEFKTVLALIAFCISIIVKGVAYSNSHWSNSDNVDVYKSLEKFPLMTQFLDRNNGNYASDCEDQKCKSFFIQYNAQRTINEALGKPPPPLTGTYSRGANSRCETIQQGPGIYGSSTSSEAAKYEKCAVDKEREVNDFKTVRVLIIVSMVADAVSILSWVVTFVKDSSVLIGRAALAVAALFGFISTLLTSLALGLFAQAIDIFQDSSISLGWPFYIILVAAFLAFVTTILAAWTLFEGRRREMREERAKSEAMYGMGDYGRDRSPTGFEEFQRQQQIRFQQQQQRANKAIAPPPRVDDDDIEEVEVSHNRQHNRQDQRNNEEQVEGSQRGTPPMAAKNKQNKPSQFDSRDSHDSAPRGRDHSRDRDDDDGASTSGGTMRRGGDARGPFQAL